MSAKAHAQRIGDRFVESVPTVPDEFVFSGAMALFLLYFAAIILVRLPVWFLAAYFGTIMVVGSVFMVRNALAEGRKEKASHHEHDH